MNSTFFKNINCWQDFDDKLSSLGNKEKGDAFELLTKCYFKIKPQYNHYDEVWLLDEVPQKELDYLKIHQPSIFIGGEYDPVRFFIKNYDAYKDPGKYCEKYKGTYIIKSAGHWVQQEKPEMVNKIIKNFLINLT